MKPFVDLLQLRREYLRRHREGNVRALETAWKSAFDGSVPEMALPQVTRDIDAKFRSFGREWELALAGQALREGYRLYELRISVLIRHAQAFQETLEERLSESRHFGAVLFAESASPQALAGEAWKSSWYFVLEQNAIPKSIGISSLPGALIPFEIIPRSS